MTDKNVNEEDFFSKLGKLDSNLKNLKSYIKSKEEDINKDDNNNNSTNNLNKKRSSISIIEEQDNK